MSESYEFKVFDDNMKRQFLLNQILEQEVQLFSLMVSPLDERDPQYDEWKWSFEEIKKSISRLMGVYEDLGGDYDQGLNYPGDSLDNLETSDIPVLVDNLPVIIHTDISNRALDTETDDEVEKHASNDEMMFNL